MPAFAECTAANDTHGPPLASPSCDPPVQESSFLTIGTPDANGAAANSSGFLKETVVLGNLSTPADEADVNLTLSIKDVRKQTDLTDYTGELGAELLVRITDKNNGSLVPGGSDPATVQDLTISFTVPCTAVNNPHVGATCETATSADAVTPGVVAEGRRSIWQEGQVRVMDGGLDGLYSTPDNTEFETSGVFAP